MNAGAATLDHLQVLPPFEIYVECYSNDTRECLGKITTVKRMYIECIHRPYSIWRNAVIPRYKFSIAKEEKENPLDSFNYGFFKNNDFKKEFCVH